MAGCRSYVYNMERQIDLNTYGNEVKLYCGPMAEPVADERAIEVSLFLQFLLLLFIVLWFVVCVIRMLSCNTCVCVGGYVRCGGYVVGGVYIAGGV